MHGVFGLGTLEHTGDAVHEHESPMLLLNLNGTDRQNIPPKPSAASCSSSRDRNIR